MYKSRRNHKYIEGKTHTEEAYQYLIKSKRKLFKEVEKYRVDTYEKPVYLMGKVQRDKVETPIWDEYKAIVSKYTDDELAYLERYKFYERAKKAYAIVMTGESTLYANVI